MKHKDYVTIRPGTFVTREILNRLGSPDDYLKIIHIAGSNGKGSTAEFFTQILIAAGKKVGTFTSPAVYDFYDQFRIDGKPVSSKIAEKHFEKAQSVSEDLNPTDFEIQTAGIIDCFKEEGCEWAVIECGMGGLNDATNAINKKELAVIASVSLEHTEYLGDTIEEICAQKAGIIKNCPAIICGYQIYDKAKEYFKGLGGILADGTVSTDGNLFSYRGKEYELSNSNGYSAYNAATAIEGAKILGLPEEAIYEGIKNVKLFGRVEKIEAGGRAFILDGAHNPAAFEPLAEYLGNFLEEITVIFGCLKDKDIDGILSGLATVRVGKIYAVPCPNPRTRTAEETKKAVLKYFTDVRTAENVSDALDKSDTGLVVVCGSFTLLKEAKQWIDKRQ